MLIARFYATNGSVDAEGRCVLAAHGQECHKCHRGRYNLCTESSVLRVSALFSPKKEDHRQITCGSQGVSNWEQVRGWTWSLTTVFQVSADYLANYAAVQWLQLFGGCLFTAGV